MKRIGFILFAKFFVVLSVHSQIIHIPADKPFIQAGIDSARVGDTVLVAEGTYYENISFNGKAITVASRYLLNGDTSHISRTIIDGSKASNPERASTVFLDSGEDTSSILCGFTIRGGEGSIIQGGEEGTLRKGGGGIFIFNSGGLIYRNFIEENQVVAADNEEVSGGGLLAWLDNDHSVIIRENLIRDNHIKATADSKGGGLGFYGGSFLCEGNEILENQSSSVNWSMGGGVYWDRTEDKGTGNSGVFRNNRIIRNQLNSNEIQAVGGGYCQEFGNQTEHAQLYNNIISQNVADYGGGAMLFETAGAIIHNTIVDNTAKQQGPNIVWIKGEGATVLFNNIIGMTAGSVSSDVVTFLSEDALTLYIINNMIGNVLGIPSGATIYNNINTSPVFNEGTFFMKQESPGIGMGLDSLELLGQWYYSPLTDLLGELRPHSVDGRSDLGALESPFKAYVYIRDSAFFQALINAGVDTDDDQRIAFGEAAAVAALDISGSSISDLTGIGAFENLDTLICSDNVLTELDLTGNQGISYLDCNLNTLSTLNISENAQLETLILDNLPELYTVCVWSETFPPDDLQLYLDGSPNVMFSTECSRLQSAADIASQFQEFNLDHADLQIKSRLFIPGNYDPEKTYPVVMTLHGSGEVGTDNLSHILYNHLATSWAAYDFQAGHPCFVFSPQSPVTNWNDQDVYLAVRYLLDSMVNSYSVDTNRIYVTGLSLGGGGTWNYLLLDPGLYAAAIPVCGIQTSMLAPWPEDIKHIPVWNFHGNADNTVNVNNSQIRMKAYMEAGEYPVLTHHWFRKEINLSENELRDYIGKNADLLYSELPNVDHNAWNTAYTMPLVKKWLFQQRKRSDTYLTLDHTEQGIKVSGDHLFSFSCMDQVARVSVWLGHFNSFDWEFLAEEDPSVGEFLFDSRGFEDHPFVRLKFLAHDTLGKVIDKDYSDYLCIDNDGNGLPYLSILNDFSIERTYTSLRFYEMDFRLGDPEGLPLNVSILMSTDQGESFEMIGNFETADENWTERINMTQLPEAKSMILRIEATDDEHLVAYQTLEFGNARGFKNVSIPDTAFLNTLIGMGADSGGDGQISPMEAQSVTSIISEESSSYGEIHDLTGIRAFTNLDTLVLIDHPIPDLDLSSNKNLVYLRAACNLEILDITQCALLKHLQLQKGITEMQNALTTLDLSGNPLLEELNLSGMESLTEVCVGSLPYPLEGMDLDTTACPSICFETDCNGECSAVGIEESTAGRISIYPNPTLRLLSIETSISDAYEIEISAPNGQKVFKQEFEGSTHQLDLSSFEPGVYFITVRSRDFVRTRKIIKL